MTHFDGELDKQHDEEEHQGQNQTPGPVAASGANRKDSDWTTCRRGAECFNNGVPLSADDKF
ncbi:MAG: hypothetical protein M3O21_05045 [Chloroflexota bacterium]|nr:hypothetical protein [Chloroflexota bacterium]